MPLATIEAFEDHGLVRRTIEDGVEESQSVMASLAAARISIDSVTDQLQKEGVEAFSTSFNDIADTIASKAAAIKTRVSAA
jgi:transaldolase/glucose-6-phosphate isomerase